MTRAILIRGLIVSLLVGSLLTLINQYELIVALKAPNFLKMGLSYAVPFGVSVFSAVAVNQKPR